MAARGCSLLFISAAASLFSSGEGSQDVGVNMFDFDLWGGRSQPSDAANKSSDKQSSHASSDKQPTDAALDIAHAVRDVVNHTVVCGGTTIRQLLRLDATDFQTVSNIDFGAIQQQADTYITSQQKKISDLDRDLETYAKVLPDLAQEDASEQEISDSLTDAMTKGFGGVHEAHGKQCGLLGEDKSYINTLETWKVTTRVTLKKKKTEVATVQKICLEMLDNCADPPQGDANTPKPKRPSESFCPRLCEELAGIASTLQITEPEVKMGSGKLTLGNVLEQIRSMQQDLKTAQKDLQECESARSKLVKFGEEIQSIKSVIDQQSARERTALQDLYKVRTKLEEDGNKLDEQQKRTLAVSKRLKQAKGSADKLATSVGEQADEEAKLAQQTKLAQAHLVTLMDSVKASGEAVRAVQEFKGDLSITMKSMLQIYEDVVQNPLKDLTEDLDQLQFDRWPQAEETKSTKDALKYAEALPMKCEAAAAKTSTNRLSFKGEGEAFHKICKSLQSEWEASTKEIIKIVNEKREDAVDAVKLLKADLHALGCSDTQRYKSQVEQGEPEHLRGVARLFEDSQFYRNYASYWLMGTSPDGEAKPGTLLKLYATLKEVHEKGEQESSLEREQYKVLEQQHAKVLARKVQLESELTEALKVQRLEGVHLKEADDILDKWRADVESLRAMKATLDPEAEQARAARDHAKLDMMTLHAGLKSSLQSSLLSISDDSVETTREHDVVEADSVANASLRRVLLHRPSNASTAE